jgi:nitrogen fixation protein FixH
MQVANPDSPGNPRSFWWPAGLIALLGVHAIAMLVVVFVATRDPSFAVEPNSYKKAIAWDVAQAERRASAALGWSAHIEINRAPDALGRRKIICRIKDKDDVLVVAAAVTIEYFHHARAADRHRVTLEPEADGVYSAWVPMTRAGIWEFRLRARRGDSVFTEVTTEQVGDSP